MKYDFMKNKFHLNKKFCVLMKNAILLLVVYAGNKLIAVHAKKARNENKN